MAKLHGCILTPFHSIVPRSCPEVVESED